MAKFSFRLQKVLEYRELQEEWAKKDYLTAQRARLEGDQQLAAVCQRRAEAMRYPTLGLADRIALERTLFALDDLEHQARLAQQVLLQDEAKALAAWTERRREVKALSSLKDKAFEQWDLDQRRKEQADLDEWAVLRRTA